MSGMSAENSSRADLLRASEATRRRAQVGQSAWTASLGLLDGHCTNGGRDVDPVRGRRVDVDGNLLGADCGIDRDVVLVRAGNSENDLPGVGLHLNRGRSGGEREVDLAGVRGRVERPGSQASAGDSGRGRAHRGVGEGAGQGDVSGRTLDIDGDLGGNRQLVLDPAGIPEVDALWAPGRQYGIGAVHFLARRGTLDLLRDRDRRRAFLCGQIDGGCVRVDAQRGHRRIELVTASGLGRGCSATSSRSGPRPRAGGRRTGNQRADTKAAQHPKNAVHVAVWEMRSAHLSLRHGGIALRATDAPWTLVECITTRLDRGAY